MKRLRYLANYLKEKFNNSISGASEEEIIDFLDDNGWFLYDKESMIKDFVEWRHKVAGKDAFNGELGVLSA